MGKHLPMRTQLILLMENKKIEVMEPIDEIVNGWSRVQYYCHICGSSLHDTIKDLQRRGCRGCQEIEHNKKIMERNQKHICAMNKKMWF